jgi:hypothetical protein
MKMLKKILSKKVQIRQYNLAVWTIGVYLVTSVGAIVCAYLLILLLLPQIYTNDFLRDRLTTELKKAYPNSEVRIAGVKFHAFKNQLDAAGVSVKKTDGTFSFSVDSISITGIRWLQIFRKESLSKHMLTKSVIQVRHIAISSGSYGYYCKQLDIYVPDSMMTAKSVALLPLKQEERFFASSKFRSARYNLTISHCEFSGVDWPGIFQGKNYHVRSVRADAAVLDILLNRDKPYDYKSPSPLMPAEFLSSIKEPLQIDTISITRGHLKYAERLVVGATPGVLTFNNVHMLMEGIRNDAKNGIPLTIVAQGNFMNSGLMKVHLVIPVLSSHLTFHYSGSLSAMDLAKLNPFLEIAEHTRIKSCSLQGATYSINVNDGKASGNLRVIYKDLFIVVLDKKTGSANGVFDQIKTFIANLIKFRKNNIPDKNGDMKIGTVNYTKKTDEAFTQFVWFGLRSAVGDVAGF